MEKKAEFLKITDSHRDILLQKIYDLEKKAHYYRDKDALYNLEGYCQSYLEEYPDDWNMLLKLALVVNEIPIVDNDKSIWILRHILDNCPHSLSALLILSSIEYYSRTISDITLEYLKNFSTNNSYEKALIAFCIARYYQNNDPQKHFEYLILSQSYYSNIPHPLYELGLCYEKKGDYKKALECINQAIHSIKKIYPLDGTNTELPFDPQELIRETIEGFYCTLPNYEFSLALKQHILRLIK